jgi:DNA-binding MarR family transcriptional regulator
VFDIQKVSLTTLIERYHTATFSVTKRAQIELRAYLGEHQLTLEQFSIMRYIRGNPSCTSTELADAFGVGKSAITSIITKLADKSCLIRIPDANDRRIIRLELTGAGLKMTADTDVQMEQWLSRYLQYFSRDEIESFINSFEKLASLMTSES